MGLKYSLWGILVGVASFEGYSPNPFLRGISALYTLQFRLRYYKLLKLLKMEDLNIFDKNGNPLVLADLIYAFIESRAIESGNDIEDVFVGVDIGFPKGKTPIWAYTVVRKDNGYDAIDLFDVGTPIKVVSLPKE